jgi:hypothetical protein
VGVRGKVNISGSYNNKYRLLVVFVAATLYVFGDEVLVCKLGSRLTIGQDMPRSDMFDIDLS